MYHIKSLFKEGTPILNTGLYHIILHYIYIYVYIYINIHIQYQHSAPMVGTCWNHFSTTWMRTKYKVMTPNCKL